MAETVASEATSLEHALSSLDEAAKSFTSDSLCCEEIKQILTPIECKSQASSDDFETTCRRLLVRYSSNLKIASCTADEKAAARLIRCRSRSIAHRITQKLIDQQSIRFKEENATARRSIDTHPENPLDDDRSGYEIESDNSEKKGWDSNRLLDYASVEPFLFSHEAFIELRAGLLKFADPTTELRLESISTDIADSTVQVVSPEVGCIAIRSAIIVLPTLPDVVKHERASMSVNS